MAHYYDNKLSADRLRLAYQIAPPRVKQYLQAEISYVTDRIHSTDNVLELGCGYGRVLEYLAQKAHKVTGIDTSFKSLLDAAEYLQMTGNIELVQMNAAALGFADNCFDQVICIQNGISAFHINPDLLVAESTRVLKTGGVLFLSSYSEKFWEARLEWFRIQSEYRLIGKIDWDKTGDGEIVCADGFRATTFTSERFEQLAGRCGRPYTIIEVDGSSIFCEITV
jgi:SAM-dependent methyltransferase